MFRFCVLAFAAAFSATTVHAQYKQSTLPTAPVMPVVRNEGAVKVYQHDRTAFARATQLELVGAPITVIGGAAGDDEHDLTHASHVALLSDGRVVTLSPVGNKYYVFSANGQFQRTLSRQGNGPGELMSPMGQALLTANTLLVPDKVNHQLNLFTADKGFVRGKLWVDQARSSLHSLVGVLSGNRVVMSSLGMFVDSAVALGKIVRPSAAVVVFNADGKGTRIAQIPDMESTLLKTTYRGKPGTRPAILRFSKFAVAAVWDSSVVTGSEDAYDFDVRNGNGTIVSRIAVNAPRIPVTRAMRDSVIALVVRRVRNTRGEGRMTLTLDELEKSERDTPFADSLPAYNVLMTSPNKTLWVVDATIPGMSAWNATAFSKDGAMIGRLRVASPGFPVVFGDDRVVIRTEDADGVVTLTVRRIGVATAKPK